MNTPDFRTLCAEMLAAADEYAGMNPYMRLDNAMKAARAALAEPEGEGPSERDIAEILEHLEWKRLPQAEGTGNSLLLDLALAVLARWGHPAPPAPEAGEVKELVAALKEPGDPFPEHRTITSEEADRAATLLQQQAAPAHAVVPVAVSDALIEAECALSDVAEGEPECDDGDPAQWSEQRCAETLAIIRPVMKLHKIRTSEWPPQPLPQAEEVEVAKLVDSLQFRRAATLIQQLSAPAPAAVPVPVSERLPGAKDWDVCGRCWMFDPCDRGWWAYRSALPSDDELGRPPWTHWLPAHAIPLPQAGEVKP
jgi:hypothetical protein